MTLIFNEKFAINPQSAESGGGGTKYLISNVTKVGILSDTKGVISDFKLSPTSYMKLPISFAPTSGDTWEMGFGVHFVPYVNTARQRIFQTEADHYGVYLFIYYVDNQYRPYLCASSNGTSWNIADTASSTSISEGDYEFRISYDGNAYKLDMKTAGVSGFTNLITETSNLVINSKQYIMGINEQLQEVWQGNIDLNKCYIKLNGVTIWQGVTAV